jgi:hypothetical protein
MRSQNVAFKPARTRDWTPERIQRLDTSDVRQLRENAQKLGATEVVALCDAALDTRPRATAGGGAGSRVPKRARNLISRHKAFQARGVFLPEGESAWSGVRSADGTVVMSIWAPAIMSSKGACSQLLWAPGEAGTQRWSQTPAGQERLKHCKLALERGGGEGILVYGEQFDGESAEHNARSVYGADPERLVHFRVEQRGAEYWAVWGAKALERAL